MSKNFTATSQHDDDDDDDDLLLLLHPGLLVSAIEYHEE